MYAGQSTSHYKLSPTKSVISMLKGKKSAQNHTLLSENIRNRLFGYESKNNWLLNL